MSTKACFNFARGNCDRGDRCPYSHDASELCPFSLKPRGCLRPNRCPFSHDGRRTPTSLGGSTGFARTYSRDESEVDASCRRWAYLIPKENASSRIRTHSEDTSTFFEKGWDLITRGDTGTYQFIITKLGEESGLRMIRALTDLMTQVDMRTRSIFLERTLPFFRIISHADVLSSLILEAPLDRIYTFLFGPNGRRAIAVFDFTAHAVRELINSIPITEELCATAITSSLAVLQRLVDVNQSAQVIEDFVPIVEAISSCIQEEATLPGARLSLTRIRRRLNIGASFPTASKQSTALTAHSSFFELSQDLPGNLSAQGPRHDNDHEDISKIRILPTAEEIMSSRLDYLPSKDPSSHHLPGLSGLLDRQFRLLREDTVGQLRDAVHLEFSHLEQLRVVAPAVGKHVQIIRNVVYRNVRLLGLDIDRRKGLQIIAGFDQPTSVRKKSTRAREEYWKNSKLLQPDALLCFVSATGRVIFFSVCDPDRVTPARNQQVDSEEDVSMPVVEINPWRLPDKVPSLSRDAGEATLLLSMVERNPDHIAWITKHLGTGYSSGQSLVEFPGIVLASFEPTLQAMQRMSRTLDLPFADIIAPSTNMSEAVVLEPPEYTRRRGFKFDLSVLAGGETLELTPGRPFDFQKLQKSSTLDEAQQSAVIQALSRALALIQGPPGTGKSYTGVAIIKALLSNRLNAKLGPIICVCFTNHALDQLLEHLLKDGVKQIIRIGSRSKSEVLQNLTLRHVSREVSPTKTEKHDKWVHNKDITRAMKDIEVVLSSLNSSTSWKFVKDYLERTSPRHHNELFRHGTDENGFQESKGRKYKVVDSWLRGAAKKLTSDRSIQELAAVSLNEMSASERQAIHQHWIQQHIRDLDMELIYCLDAFHKAKVELEKCHHEVDLRCLLQAHVIGVTTTGMARNMDVLGRVRAKVMICEEAGEVLEPHILTALLNSVEHAVLIGDHEQLRPHINNYELQYDNPRGEKYALDISLFERLVKLQVGNSKVPLSTLKIQRRMHPSIAELVRVPLYPELQDHPSVLEYPEVNGMRDRLFWLDHREKEDSLAYDAVSQSKTNSFEVELVAALVSHLVRQGTYGREDIAVLTPYLGQLQKIRKRLADSFEIVVGDRDLEDLEAQGLQENDAWIDGQSQPQKTTLLQALKLSSVDNFQGDEASVVIISLVRSNDERKCGFLKTSNRINVLLSRARHGMYIIGNSHTASSIKMWSDVIAILEKSNNIGPKLALCCPRHRDTPIEVSLPDDFVSFAPEGGCRMRCSSRLVCGHACPNMCHSTSLHNAVRCLERCNRVKKGCEHACPRVCGDRCESKCQVIVSNITLPCGHTAQQLRCHEAQIPEKVLCQFEVEQTMLNCKHSIMVKCHELPLGADYPCSATCGAPLDCGHNCIQRCKDCSIKKDGKTVQITHGICKSICGRPYTTCGHGCKATCHGTSPCQLCTEPCEVSCDHSKCEKLCQEPCAPCVEDCSWSCPHRGRCPLPCAVPCNRLPCSERCTEMLGCGHQCPSICGETCPDTRYCQVCAEPSVQEIITDFILYSTFKDVKLDENPCIVPSCGHLLTLDNMDGHMSMSEHYVVNSEGSIVGVRNSMEPFSTTEMKNCPSCRGPLQNINRYNRIVRRKLLDESTKKFITWANARFIPLLKKMDEIEADLRQIKEDGQDISRSLPEITVPLGPLELKGTRDEQVARITSLIKIGQRFRPIILHRKHIKGFLAQVDEKEQPFGRIHDLLQDARRHRGVDVQLGSNVDVLQVRNRLLATVLLIRCDYAILVNFLNDYKKVVAGDVSSRGIHIDLTVNRKECETLIAESRAKVQPGNIVEGQLYWARFLALERGLTEPGEKMKKLLDEAKAHLQDAQQVCGEYPGQTAGMISEVEEVQKMLRDSVFYMPVSNEEKAAIYAAMAFPSTGHWYYCINGHPFTVGDCGMPMETSQCPQCGSPIGGQNHMSISGVTPATDLEREFGGLRMNT